MKILFVGAHADDIEIGCGGTLLKTQKKNSVFNFVATDSEYFDENHKLIRSKKDAENDLRRCYKNTKVKTIIGKQKVFKLKSGDNLNKELLGLKNKIKPDAVFIPWILDTHADHRNLATSSLYVFKNIPNILMYRINLNTNMPEFKRNFYVDISNFMSKKKKLISNFHSENKRKKNKWLKMIEIMCKFYALNSKAKYAVSFEIIRIEDRFIL